MNKRSNGKMKYRMLSILGLVIFFGVWEAAVRLGWVSHRSLNAPSEVVETFIYKLTNANPDGSTLPQHRGAGGGSWELYYRNKSDGATDSEEIWNIEIYGT